MPNVPKGRRVGRAAVNAVRALFEDHEHIVQEIDGANDFGEDMYVTFTSAGQVTSDVVKVQVKGGTSWRRGNGYAIPVDHHGDTWANGNVPVLCIVYDPDSEGLFWANATQQLRQAGMFNPPSVIGVTPNAVLDENTMEVFVAQIRRYVGRYRGRQAILTHLGEMSGVDFDSTDHVLHFVSGDEDLIFWKRPGDTLATLLMSTHDWAHWATDLPSLVSSEIPPPPGMDTWPDSDLPSAADLDLTRAELMWVTSCFSSTRQADEEAGHAICDGCTQCTGEEAIAHAEIAVDLLDNHILNQIAHRLESEPDLLQRSIAELRRETHLEPEILAELGPLETDARTVRQVSGLSRATLDGLSPKAARLAVLYLVRSVVVGDSSLPLDEQVQVMWRVPIPGSVGT